MSPDPTVSLVIPAYNAERHLGEALDSVRAQTAPAAEVIVVDDGSTDDTRRWAGHLPGLRWLAQAHAGAAAARNAGAAAATSRFLAFLDADDRWLPERLAIGLAVFAREPDVGLVFGHARQFRGGGPAGVEGVRVDEAPLPGLVPGALLLRRDTFWRVGPFETTWRVGEFVDWYARAQAQGLRTVVCPEVVLERRVHAGNLGIRERGSKSDYVRILKAALDRRRDREGR
jgi:glycosyltransferase involved in cell wall biosynthesis